MHLYIILICFNRFHKTMQTKYGKNWKKVVMKIETTSHPINKWTNQVCEELKTNRNEQDKTIIDRAESDIYCAFNGKTIQDNYDGSNTDFETLDKDYIFKIVANICHGVVTRAGKDADEKSDPEEEISSIFIMFEIIEVFKVVFGCWESRFSKPFKSFPMVHQTVQLGVDRVGNEWFLDLEIRKYLDVKKNKNFKGLKVCQNENDFEHSFVFNDTMKYWSSFNQTDNLFDEQVINDETMHVLSPCKVFQHISKDLLEYETNSKSLSKVSS